MRRFHIHIPDNDWPLLNRILNFLSNRTLPKIDEDTQSIRSDLTYLSDCLNIIDGGDADEPA